MAKRTNVTLIIDLWDQMSRANVKPIWIRDFIFSDKHDADTHDLFEEEFDEHSAIIGGAFIIRYMAKWKTLEDIFRLAQEIHNEFDADVSCVVWDDEGQKCCGFFCNQDQEELYRKQKEDARRNQNSSEQILS